MSNRCFGLSFVVMSFVLISVVISCGSVDGALTSLSSSKGEPVKCLNSQMEAVLTKGAQKLRVRLMVRMVADSVIWVSAQPFVGMEVARVMLSPDSVRVLNRVTREWAAQKWIEVGGVAHNVGYASLQDHLCNFVKRTKEGQQRRISYQGIGMKVKIAEKGMNERGGMSFVIPSGYARVSMNELLNGLK